MGRRLAVDMYEWAPTVRSHRAMHVLVYMALHALDEDRPSTPAAQYFAGHRPVAWALGYMDQHKLEVEPTKSQLNEIGKAVKMLLDVGALRLIAPAMHGSPARYQLVRRPVDERPSPSPPGLA